MACAVPVPPTGGPPDQTPPSLVTSTPENGTTLFSGTELHFEFDEAVDTRSFTSAFSISPDIAGIPQITGSGKNLRVQLPAPPRPETTYIVTLESTLRDAHGVVLERPITIAFSTGAQIDKAQMSGKVVHQADGKDANGIDVFAFANSDSNTLSQQPLYRTQTGKDGTFAFRSVAKQDYYVVAVADRNRNRLIDPTEKLGIPPVDRLQADTSFVTPDSPWILGTHDSTQPVLDRVRALSGRDLELRFSEALWLDLNRPASFGLGTNHTVELRREGVEGALFPQLYFEETNPRIVLARVDTLLPGSYSIHGSFAASDSSRNQVRELEATFTVAESLPSSKQPALRGWFPDSSVVSDNLPRTIWPREMVGFRITHPPSQNGLDPNSPIKVDAVLRDTSGYQIPAQFDQVDATLFVLQKAGDFKFDQPFFVDLNLHSIGGPDSLITAAFVYALDKEMGALSLQIEPTKLPPAHSYRAEVFRQTDRTRAMVQLEGSTPSFVLDKLPGGMRVFMRISTGEGPYWNAGNLSPWSKPDPLTWVSPTESVRARWEIVLPDTVSFQLKHNTTPVVPPSTESRSVTPPNN